MIYSRGIWVGGARHISCSTIPEYNNIFIDCKAREIMFGSICPFPEYNNIFIDCKAGEIMFGSICPFHCFGLWDLCCAPSSEYRTLLCTVLHCAPPTFVVHHGAQGGPMQCCQSQCFSVCLCSPTLLDDRLTCDLDNHNKRTFGQKDCTLWGCGRYMNT